MKILSRGSPMEENRPLLGKRVVVIEDDATVKSAIEATLGDAGAVIVSSFHQKLDAAILDVRIGRGITSLRVAMRLELRLVPFLFYTGYSQTFAKPLRYRFPDCKILPKPLAADQLVDEIVTLLGRKAPGFHESGYRDPQ